MAHLHGTDYVGSMVVLEDGLPAKREYRRFKVNDVPGNDDYAAMEEVLTRRLTAYLEERDRPIGTEDEDGNRIPMDVSVDDRVLYAKYAGTEVKLDNIKYLILKESDILAILL